VVSLLPPPHANAVTEANIVSHINGETDCNRSLARSCPTELHMDGSIRIGATWVAETMTGGAWKARTPV
jgi:hypothetical protein